MVIDKRANRYSLKLIDLNGNEITIPMTYNGNYMKKAPLTKIDMMTTSYENQEALNQALMDLGYPYGNLFVEYRAQGQTKLINVAYSDQVRIAEESRVREQAIFNGKSEPKLSENVVALAFQLTHIQRKYKNLWSYLQGKKYISKDLVLLVHIHNHLLDIGADQNEILEYEYDIMKQISRYRVFRDIHMGISAYYYSLEAANTNTSTLEKNEPNQAKTLILKPHQPESFTPDKTNNRE